MRAHGLIRQSWKNISISSNTFPSDCNFKKKKLFISHRAGIWYQNYWMRAREFITLSILRSYFSKKKSWSSKFLPQVHTLKLRISNWSELSQIVRSILASASRTQNKLGKIKPFKLQFRKISCAVRRHRFHVSVNFEERNSISVTHEKINAYNIV